MAKITAVLYFDTTYQLSIYQKSSRLAYINIFASSFSSQCSLTDIENICLYYRCKKFLFYSLHKQPKTTHFKPKTINIESKKDFINIATNNLSPTNEDITINDGIYLKDLLRSFNSKLPENFNIGIKYLRDTYSINEKLENFISTEALNLANILNIDIDKFILNYSLKISLLNLEYENIYKALKYQLTNEQRETISSLASSTYKDQDKYLVFIITLMQVLYINKNIKKYKMVLENNILKIYSASQMSKELISKIQVPSSLKLELGYL